MINAWQWWMNALEGKRAPIHESEPQQGYYRVKCKGSLVPVAYWQDSKNGGLRCLLDNQHLDEQRAIELWPYASKNPVSYEAYQAKIGLGRWPDENEAVAGHNRAPLDDTPEAIAERINDLARDADRLIKAGEATTQDACDQASDLANTFGELENKVSVLHRVEKEPHIEAGRLVDRKWFALRDRAAELKRVLKAIVITPWLIRRKAQVEAANAAEIARGTPPEALPQQRVTAGLSKRQSAIRTYYRAVIEDKAALINNLKDHPELIACIQGIADAAAKKKIALPGCKIVSEQRAA